MFHLCFPRNKSHVLVDQVHLSPEQSPVKIKIKHTSVDESRLQNYLSPHTESYPQTLYPELYDNFPLGRSVKPIKNSSRKSTNKCKSSPMKKKGVAFDSDFSEETVTVSDVTTDTYFPLPMTRILPNLYLGSYDNAIDGPRLKAKRITHVLSLIGKRPALDFVQIESIPMNDLGRSDLKRVLEKVLKFVKFGQQEGNSILIHCLSGQNRSATVVIAILMINERKTLYNAYKMVKTLRPIVQINQGYAKQLLTLEKDLFGKNSLPSDWLKRGQIDMATGEVNYKYENLE